MPTTVPPEGPYPLIPQDKLLLDVNNPRLAEFGVSPKANQFDLLKVLWENMAVQEVAMSIAHNGFFSHEPLFVEKNKKGHLVVIEGNRRLAAVRLLLSADLRDRLKATDLPAISPERAREIFKLPVVETTRKNEWRYLGFKHVNGPSTWGSYAKAQYIAQVRNEYHVSLDDIAAQIGDYSSTVQRMYRGLMIIEQAEDEKLFSRADVAKSKFFFNYIYTGMDMPGIKSFLALNTKSTTEKRPVPASKHKNLELLLLWLYGKKSRNIPSLIKSQNPDLRILDTVLLNPPGVKALSDGLPLRVARDIGLGDERLFRQSLQEAKQSLQRALGTVTTGYSADDVELLKTAGDVEELASDLVAAMRQKRRRDERDTKKPA
jgi:ParB-like nuclease family protein